MKRIILLFSFTFLINSTISIAGSFEWAQMVYSATRGTTAKKVLTDNNNNVIVGGQGLYCQTCNQGFLAKFDSLGQLIFNFQINSGSYNRFLDVEVDGNGNIYLVAEVISNSVTINNNTITFPSGLYGGILTTKLSPSGSVLWSIVDSVVSNTQIAVEQFGEFYTINNTTLAKYNNAGLLLWSINIVANAIDVNNNELIIASQTTLYRISKNNGNIINSLTINGCNDIKLGLLNEVYLSNNNGITKFTNNSIAWNSPLVGRESIAYKNNLIWATDTLNTLPITGANTSLTQINNNGIVVSHDTLHNSVPGPICIDNNNNVLVCGGYATTTSAFPVYKPYILIYENWNLNPGFILGRFIPSSIARLNFAQAFWNLNDNTLGYWNSKPCPGGSTFDIKYRFVDASLTANSIVFAQLSDSLGSFNNPVTIGAIAGTSLQGTITCQIPLSTVSSTLYRIRLTSVSPTLKSVQTSTSLRIDSPISTITLNGSSTPFCSKTRSLTVSPTNSQYYGYARWQKNSAFINTTNANDPVYFPTSSGTYRCILTDGYGCSRASNNQITVTVLPLPTAALTPSGNSEICSGDSLQLSVTSTLGNSYQWFKNSIFISNQTNPIYFAKTGGYYKVQVTGINGCTKTSTNNILKIYKSTITPLGPTTFCQGSSVVLSANSSNVNSWQWLKNNIKINGAISQFYIATQGGSYKVKTINTLGCESASAIVNVTVNCREGNLSNLELEELNIYPNPTNGIIYFDNYALLGISEIRVFDLSGRDYSNLLGATQFSESQLDCSALEQGTYLLKLIDNKGNSVTKRFVKM